MAPLRDADRHYSGPIVDARHHLWEVSLGQHPWPGDAADPCGEAAWLDALEKLEGIAARYFAHVQPGRGDTEAMLQRNVAHRHDHRGAVFREPSDLRSNISSFPTISVAPFLLRRLRRGRM